MSDGPGGNDDVQARVVAGYSAHPSPGRVDKLAYVDRRMELRLHCCGVEEVDYVDADVLDAGCGTGEYSCWFASRGARVTGIDLSEDALEEGRSYAEAEGLAGVTFEQRSVLDTGFPADRFDLAYCTGVLHHTPAPFAGLRELCRVTRPRGKVVISLYHRGGFLLRRMRCAVTRLLAGGEPSARVRWGRRLFPFTARRLANSNPSNPEAALHDYFGVELQSRHGLRDVLGWFDRAGLDYAGSFPPSRLRDYPALFRHRAYGSLEEELKRPVHRWLARLGRGREVGGERPGPVSRLLVGLLWTLARLEIFSFGGEKRS